MESPAHRCVSRRCRELVIMPSAACPAATIKSPPLQAWVSATSWPSSARTQATISVVGAPGVKILATPIR